MASRGLFITFEGGDGSGKTTQAELLDVWLRERGETTLRSREPGGTEVGEQLREIVLHHRGEISSRAEALLYAADRAQHIDTKIRPALERGEIVLQDRYIDSSLAYQGAGRALGVDEVRALSVWASGDLWPNLTILLDLDPDNARERLNSARTRFDRLEAEKSAFHGRVRTVFLELAQAEPERFLVLDATLSIDDLATRIRERVAALLAD
ncbi:dTMP kinase [Mycetocola sp. BIGb0189]|uniref:dTMP kinase n=1 Tax=Mycetocola sp. BIGb0189 TaxID=2940604 RepID=UPI002168D69C|nr:dTMP kinase [Mycetocola sp. BIGb0189]MCS4276263.1 dTMP kinase [Mycetocola sp. BIGb0189]